MDHLVTPLSDVIDVESDNASTTVSSLPEGSNVAEGIDVYRLVSFLCAVLIVLVALFGCIANICSCIIYTRPYMLRASSINCLLAGLAVADVLVAVLGAPVFAILGISNYFSRVDEFFDASLYLTKWVYPFAMMAQTASIWMLIVITCERFVAVYYPLNARSWCTTRRAKYVVVATIALSCAYNCVRFWEYELRFELNEETNRSEPILSKGLRQNETYQTVYLLWLYLITHFIVPGALLILLNGLIVLRIKKTKQQRQSLTQSLSRQETKEFRTAYMMLTVIVVWLLCNTSAFVLNAFETSKSSSSTEPDGEETVPKGHSPLFYLLDDLNNLLVEVNSAVNTLIYLRFSKRFREVFLALFCGRGEYKAVNGASMMSHASRRQTAVSVRIDTKTDDDLTTGAAVPVIRTPDDSPCCSVQFANGHAVTGKKVTIDLSR